MNTPSRSRPTTSDRIAVAILAGAVTGCIAFLLFGPLPSETEWQRLISAQDIAAAASPSPTQVAGRAEVALHDDDAR